MNFNADIAKQNATGPSRHGLRYCARSQRGCFCIRHTPD